MGSHNLQLPCVQPPTSLYNPKPPHGRHGHYGWHGNHGRHGHGGRGEHGGYSGQDSTVQYSTGQDGT